MSNTIVRLLVISATLALLVSCENRQPATADAEPIEQPLPTLPDRISEHLNYSLRTAALPNKEVRLWVNYENVNLCMLHSLKESTTSSMLTHHYVWSSIYNYYEFDSAFLSFDKPQISTQQLIDNLYAVGFRELGDQPDSIAMRIADGTSYHLELRDSTYYKCIVYNNPHKFDEVNNRAFMRIIAELETGFNWKYQNDHW